MSTSLITTTSSPFSLSAAQTVEFDYWQFFSLPRALQAMEDHYARLGSAQTEGLTAQAYRRDLEVFLEWLGGAFFEENTLNSYITHLVTKKTRDGSNLAPQTINRYLAPVRLFIKYLSDQNPEIPIVLDGDPQAALLALQIQSRLTRKALQLRTLAETKGLPIPAHDNNLADQALDHDTLKYLIEHLPSATLADLRNRAAVIVIAKVGLRISELRRLTLSNFERASSKTYKLTVRGKRNNKKSIACDASAYRALLDYIKAFNKVARAQNKPLIGRDTPIWRHIDRYGKPTDKSEAVSRTSMWVWLTSTVEKVINTHVNPHRYRHSVATIMLELHAPANKTQSQMRHSSLAMTGHYGQGRTDYDAMNPCTYGYLS